MNFHGVTSLGPPCGNRPCGTQPPSDYNDNNVLRFSWSATLACYNCNPQSRVGHKSPLRVVWFYFIVIAPHQPPSYVRARTWLLFYYPNIHCQYQLGCRCNKIIQWQNSLLLSQLLRRLEWSTKRDVLPDYQLDSTSVVLVSCTKQYAAKGH